MTSAKVTTDMAMNFPTFTSVFTRTLVITIEKLLAAANYLSWGAVVELWFIGLGS